MINILYFYYLNMGSSSDIHKNYNKNMNDSISICSVDYKLKKDNSISYRDHIKLHLPSIHHSDTRENTKISELKEETFAYKFIWSQGGKNVKLAGTFLDNWQKEIELQKNIKSGLFEVIINLTKSKHEFKFIVDNKWICSQSYKIIKNKNNFNNMIDLTNYSPNVQDFQNINEQINKRKRKLSIEYGCIYIKKSDFEREIPSIPIFFVKRFNFNKRPEMKCLRKKVQSFLDLNINRNILENNEFKSILTISHDKLCHICIEAEKNYKINETYIKIAITQRTKNKYLTLIYYTSKKANDK